MSFNFAFLFAAVALCFFFLTTTTDAATNPLERISDEDFRTVKASISKVMANPEKFAKAALHSLDQTRSSDADFLNDDLLEVRSLGFGLIKTLIRTIVAAIDNTIQLIFPKGINLLNLVKGAILGGLDSMVEENALRSWNRVLTGVCEFIRIIYRFFMKFLFNH